MERKTLKIIMKNSLVLILAGIMGIMLAASGCTSSSPATTVTPAATTAAPVESLTTLATATPALEVPSWTGTWNSSWLEKDGNHTVSRMTLTQTGREVTGNYSYTYPTEGTYTGSLNGTVQGTTLAGTYAETDNDTGLFVFTLAENRDSFTGRWVHAENRSELDNSTLTWNGVRI